MSKGETIGVLISGVTNSGMSIKKETPGSRGVS